jgi:hypothetical protein
LRPGHVRPPEPDQEQADHQEDAREGDEHPRRAIHLDLDHAEQAEHGHDEERPPAQRELAAREAGDAPADSVGGLRVLGLSTERAPSAIKPFAGRAGK